MSNLSKRFITGFIGAALVIGAILYNEITFLLLLIAIVILGLLEFYRLCNQDGIRPQKMFGVLISMIIFLPPFIDRLLGATWNPVPLLLILPYLIFIRELYTKSEKPYTNIGFTLLGIIYLAVPLFFFYLISFHGENRDHYNPTNIIGYFFILWANDTGAYFTGTYLGKHKLFERLSPKKTWEGFFGGALTATGVALIIAHYFTNLEMTDWLIIAGIIIVTGSLGDLVGSLFKRSIHVKDSGILLPGHGGILDRFDALYISAPFVLFYLTLAKT